MLIPCYFPGLYWTIPEIWVYYLVISGCDLSALEAGHLVALQGEYDCNKPLIGRCIRVLEEEIEVAWMDGSYSTVWRSSKQPDPQNSKRLVDWTDLVPKSSIILHDFTLTSTGRLRKVTITHLKKFYSKDI